MFCLRIEAVRFVLLERFRFFKGIIKDHLFRFSGMDGYLTYF